MIGSLRGAVLSRDGDEVIVECAGVGYEVSVSSILHTPVGEDLFLWVHTDVREDAMVLFGFAEREERWVFRLLTSVSGVGPRLAMALLSGMSVADLAGAVAAGDTARLSRAKGVGKKTASRIVLELKDKLLGDRGSFAPSGGGSSPAGAAVQAPSLRGDLMLALQALGYKGREIDTMLRGLEIGSEDDVDSLLRRVLSNLRR